MLFTGCSLGPGSMGGVKSLVRPPCPWEQHQPSIRFLPQPQSLSCCTLVSHGWDSWLGEQTTPAGLFNLTGANCLAKSPLGRTPLHVVAAMGRTDCVQPLLEHGASIHDRDLKSDTPITIARRLKRGHLEHKMFLLYWMVKSGSRDPDLVGRKALEKSSPGMATRRSTILIS